MLKIIRTFIAFSILFCGFSGPAIAEISDRKKALIDELIEVQGGMYIGEDYAMSFTNEMRKK